MMTFFAKIFCFFFLDPESEFCFYATLSEYILSVSATALEKGGGLSLRRQWSQWMKSARLLCGRSQQVNRDKSGLWSSWGKNKHRVVVLLLLWELTQTLLTESKTNKMHACNCQLFLTFILSIIGRNVNRKQTKCRSMQLPIILLNHCCMQWELLKISMGLWSHREIYFSFWQKFF